MRGAAMMDLGDVPEEPFVDMTPQELRNSAADAMLWVLDTQDLQWAEFKEGLRVQIDTEVRDELGPGRLNRIAQNVDLDTGVTD
jgi:hypothetical protein